jgi:beta-glucosidase/6-phospho-beta-glucosidase/beta-galactosidase
VITENGTPDVEQADAVLRDHLVALHGAIEDGADVRGYFYWSYVDNYEWNHGMSWKLGLYGLDLDTKERSERPAMTAYRRYARANGVIADP